MKQDPLDGQILRIGSRGSSLALRQVDLVKEALTLRFPELKTETVVMATSGDWKPSDGEVRLSAAAGGKGQFTKEIEESLLAGRIDCAVHSVKDMESHLPEGLAVQHMLAREDPRDALIVRGGLKAAGLADLPEGATVGTASVRRQAFLLGRRPDINVVPLRGNVHTRLEKVKAGRVDATFLAVAGLKRLGLEDEIAAVLEPGEMLPGAGQGAVGIEICKNNINILAVFDQINCMQTCLCVGAERAALQALGGSCHTPIGAYAEMDNGSLYLRMRVAALDGAQDFSDEIRAHCPDFQAAEETGRRLGSRIREKLPDDLLRVLF